MFIKITFALYILFSCLPSLASTLGDFPLRSQIWADSVFNTLTMEQKVAQLFIVDVKEAGHEGKNQLSENISPGFLKISPDSRPKCSGSPANMVQQLKVLDITNGFYLEASNLPFPGGETISMVDDHNRQSMLGHLNAYMVANRLRAFITCARHPGWVEDTLLAHESYLPESRIWTPSVDLNGFTSANPHLDVHQMPAPILSLLPPRLPQPVLIIEGISPDTITNGHQKYHAPGKIISVEELLKEGTLFKSANINNDIVRLVTAFNHGWLNPELLAKSCKYILAFKHHANTKRIQNIEFNDITLKELHLRAVYENSVAMFQHVGNHILPLESLDLKVGFHSRAIHSSEFISMASNYLEVNSHGTDSLNIDLVFWMVDNLTPFENGFISEVESVRNSYPGAKLVMVWGGELNSLPFYELPAEIDALLATPSNIPFSWQVLAQTAFNGIAINPAKTSGLFSESLAAISVVTNATRLKFGIPAEVGVNPSRLQEINELMEVAIRQRAFPGAQVLIARKGVVIYNKSFGYHTYDRTRLVKNDDIYDLASITKIAATVPVLMSLHDMDRWRPSDLVSTFVPEIGNTSRRLVTMGQLLLHESGFPSSLPFHFETIDRDKLEGSLFSRRRSATHPLKIENRLYLNGTAIFRGDLFSDTIDYRFSIPVARGLYLDKHHRDQMFMAMINSNMLPQTYRYSDLNFILLQRIAEDITNQSLDLMADEMFFNDIGAFTLQFNPWKIFPQDIIVPTENDIFFRRQLLQGYVHDPSAAMMGGVAGHAGLFGNATDLAKFMQLLLNKGTYGGKRFLNASTVEQFTSQQNDANRRGLGFDMAGPANLRNRQVSEHASQTSYGHSGFTGVLAWIDPEYELIYIFLSNRIHPASYNRKLFELDTRVKIHDIIYESILPKQ